VTSLERIRETRDEAALIRTVQAEGASALGRKAANELLLAYQRPVYLWCYRYVKNHDQALDLAQDVFMRVLHAIPRFEGRSDFALWLFVIARNCCLTAIRRAEPVDDAEVDFDELLAMNAHAMPDRRLENAEEEARVLALIRNTLDSVEQKAVWLRCMDRMPVDAITEVLEIGERSGARGVLQRARRKLRAALEKRAREEPGP
jgi:RNA polymerase sigma-70 factor (ECF subfamily)